jgi:oligosaccharyltransferase complex subunit delta (ribophorin II)
MRSHLFRKLQRSFFLIENRFSSNSPVEEIIELGPSDTLRLTFTATDDGKAARPHQSFIIVEDTASHLDTIIPVPVKLSGKAKIDIVSISSLSRLTLGPS